MNKRIQFTDNSDYLAATLSCIGDGVIAVDQEGLVLFMNDKAEDLTGWTSELARKKNLEQVLRLYSSQVNESVEMKRSRVFDTGHTEGLSKNSKVISKDGDEYFVSASFSLIRAADGTKLGVVVVFRDITRIKSIEEALLAEKDNLKNIFDYMPLGMVVIDQYLKITRLNNTILDMFEIDREKALWNTIGDGVNCVNSFEKGCGLGEACNLCMLRSTLLEIIRFDEFVSDQVVPFSVKTKKGIVHYHFKLSFLKINEFGQKHLMVVFEDVTEQLKYEDSLIKAEKASLNLLDELPVMVWRSDLNHDFDYVNKRLLEFAGIKGISQEENQLLKMLSEEDEKRVVSIYKEAFAQRKEFAIEVKMHRHDGIVRDVLLTVNPYFDLNGNFSGYIGTCLDYTNRKRAEEIARASREKYRSLFMHMEDGFLYQKLLFDEYGNVVDGQIMEMNIALESLTGLTRKACTNKSIGILFESEDVFFDTMVLFYRQMIKGDVVDKREMFIKSAKKWLEVSVYATDNDHAAAILSDITAKKESQLALKKAMEMADAASKAKSEFLANMSHEIRTPLNGIVGMIELTLLKLNDPELREHITVAKGCVKSLLNIINDILDFSKMEVGKLSLKPVTFNLYNLMIEIIAENKVRAKEKGLELRLDYHLEVVTQIVADPNRLKQVMTNLIGNAIKFTEEGHIIIKVMSTIEMEQSVIEIRVADTGIGISAQNQMKLFKSFSQIDGTYTRQRGGTGLGLAISKQLIELMNGTIHLESEEGVGSTFTCMIPFIKGTVLDTKQLAENVVKKVLREGKILLVEDDRINQLVTTKLLRENGYQVEVAENGQIAVDYYQKKSFDLILMDIQMPVMDGIMATKKIRELEKEGEHITIIAQTAFALKGDKEHFLEVGMDDYISKPLDFSKLVDLIEKHKRVPTNPLHSGYDKKIVVNEHGEIQLENYSKDNENVNLSETMNMVNNIFAEIGKAIQLVNFELAEIKSHQLKELLLENELEQLKDIAFKMELASRKENMDKLIENEKIFSNLLNNKLNC